MHSNKALYLYKCNALFFTLLDYNVYLIKYFKCEVLFILGINTRIIYFFAYEYLICQTVYKIEFQLAISNTVNIASGVVPELFANVVYDLLGNIGKVIIWNTKAVAIPR